LLVADARGGGGDVMMAEYKDDWHCSRILVLQLDNKPYPMFQVAKLLNEPEIEFARNHFLLVSRLPAGQLRIQNNNIRLLCLS